MSQAIYCMTTKHNNNNCCIKLAQYWFSLFHRWCNVLYNVRAWPDFNWELNICAQHQVASTLWHGWLSLYNKWAENTPTNKYSTCAWRESRVCVVVYVFECTSLSGGSVECPLYSLKWVFGLGWGHFRKSSFQRAHPASVRTSAGGTCTL